MQVNDSILPPLVCKSQPFASETHDVTIRVPSININAKQCAKKHTIYSTKNMPSKPGQ